MSEEKERQEDRTLDGYVRSILKIETHISAYRSRIILNYSCLKSITVQNTAGDHNGRVV